MAKAKTPEKSKKPNDSDTKDKSSAQKVATSAEASAPVKGKNNAASKKSASSVMVAQTAVTVETAPAPSIVAATLAAEVPVEDEEVILTDAEGRRYCRATDCDQIGLVDAYCRYHYLYFWKKIQIRKKILADGKLDRYIEELTSRYTDKFVELLRKDTRTEKDFLAAVQELELDGSDTQSANDDDESKTYIEEISGVGGTENTRDDEGY